MEKLTAVSNFTDDIAETNKFRLTACEITFLQENRHILDETLVSTKGIISFMIDLERKRCAVRVSPKLSIKSLVSEIRNTCGMKPYLVICNSDNIEVRIFY